MGIPVLVTAVIILVLVLSLPERPWLLALALLFGCPVLAGFLTFAIFAGVGLIGAGRYQALDVFPVMFLLELGTALDCIYPAATLLALLALTASPIASRLFGSDSVAQHTRVAAGAVMGTFAGALVVLMLVVAHRAPFFGRGASGPYPFQDAPVTLLTGALDGVLVAAGSRKLTLFALRGGVASVPAALVLLWWSLQPPSDAALRARFDAHRADIETIVAMMSEDRHMTRIADDFLWRDDESNRGISRQRWDLYRSIFRRAGIRHGTYRRENSCDLELLVWTAGLAIAGSSVSFVHCGGSSGGACHVEPPCLEGKYSGSGDDGHEAYRYTRLAPDWYIFQEND